MGEGRHDRSDYGTMLRLSFFFFFFISFWSFTLLLGIPIGGFWRRLLIFFSFQAQTDIPMGRRFPLLPMPEWE